jgi:hypothetical protein
MFALFPVLGVHGAFQQSQIIDMVPTITTSGRESIRISIEYMATSQSYFCGFIYLHTTLIYLLYSLCDQAVLSRTLMLRWVCFTHPLQYS